MKIILYLIGLLALCSVSSYAEFRIWEDVNGNVWEGEFETLAVGEVVMHDQAGKRTRIKPEKLSKTDQLYLEKMIPPKLSLDVSKTTDNSGSSGSSLEKVRCIASIKQTDTRSYSGELTAVLLTVGVDIRTRSSSTVSREQYSFKLPEKRGQVIQFKGDSVRFQKASSKSGRAYYGYVLIVWDRFGNPVAVKSNRDSLAEKAQRIGRPMLKSN